ncbi:MAG TPA: TIGR04442 family protein [Thermoanaerobaculia bacterium]|nr:TIGR04442 family protein [Thermoanaerobaculia bacterium]HUM30338.1 TIGR04442 family protein [Thermoanaerobaculia bacterium]HXK68511.1 TIGR04442 family protein [Thermoanaerobaculia bacterium]
MIRSVSYHGHVHEDVAFFATITGPDIHRRFFLQQMEGEVCFFSDMNHLRMTAEGIEYNGNGGAFNAYMFGTQIPPEDMFTEDVTNRLVFYGAFQDEETDEIYFTTRTSGKESYERIFLNGHAVSNYFFFVADHDAGRSVVERQEMTLKCIGKLLKRSADVGQEHDVDLMRELRESLQEQGTDIFLFRFVHLPNRAYQKLCRQIYSEYRGFPPEIMERYSEVSDRVDSYQQERIKIDIIYHNPDNARIIREYRQTLMQGRRKGALDASLQARLQRLRTIALRQNVPSTIFDTLEDILFSGKTTLKTVEEPPYLSKTREVLEGFLIESGPFTHEVAEEELIALLKAKQISVEQHNNAFEEILLDVGRLIDERVAQTEDFQLLESFGNVVTYLDRFDATAALINRLAFMDNVEIEDSNIRSLVNNRRIFNDLKSQLFDELFIEPLFSNPYLPRYGRRKLELVQQGLIRISDNEMTLQELVHLISEVTTEERFFSVVLQIARERIKHVYAGLSTQHGLEAFVKEIRREVVRQQLGEEISDRLILEAIHHLQMESLYLGEILPEMMETGKIELRKDFLHNSGLDLFTVEELEQNYLQMENVDPARFSRLLSAAQVA